MSDVVDRPLQRAGGLELLALDQPRHQRVERRPADRRAGGDQRRRHEQHPQLRLRQQRVRHEPRDDEQRAHLGEHHEPPAVERVGQRAADQCEHEDRDELRHAEQADDHRRAGDLVRLHRDRDERDHRAEVRHRLSGDQQPVLAPPSQQPGIDRHGGQDPSQPPRHPVPLSVSTTRKRSPIL
jgi:hypothetical protein